MANTHAIVIGGSFSGLFAGRVLSEFFDRVTVLDRDSFPEGVQDRAGVPQARHVHGLLIRGLWGVRARVSRLRAPGNREGRHLS